MDTRAAVRRHQAVVVIQRIVRGHIARNRALDARIAKAREGHLPEPAPSPSRGPQPRAPPTHTMGASAGYHPWPTAWASDHLWSTLPSTDGEALALLRASRELRVLACTWNMGAKPFPKISDLPSRHASIGAAASSQADGEVKRGQSTPATRTERLLEAGWAPHGRFHLLAFCTQECERSIAASVLNTSKPRWEAALETLVGKSTHPPPKTFAEREGEPVIETELYSLVASHTLQATQMVVFAHKSIVRLISNVESEAVACGVGKMLGNKGALCVGMCVGGTSLLFVGCHLAAGSGATAMDARCSDVERIERTCSLAPPDCPKDDKATLTSRFDRVVWMGDLNFRLDTTRAFADAAIREARVPDLLARDELRRAMKSGAAFRGFGEAPIRFRPTYKVARVSAAEAVAHGHTLARADVNLDSEASEIRSLHAAHALRGAASSLPPPSAGVVDVYDPSKKRRVPSWTDRVLVRPPNNHCKVLSYRSLHQVDVSDHFPVCASIGVQLRRFAERARDLVEGGAPWARDPDGKDSRREGVPGGHVFEEHSNGAVAVTKIDAISVEVASSEYLRRLSAPMGQKQSQVCCVQ
jgi:hypothetical protein